jgi:cytochrome c-type biogenesis protein CcmE
MNKYFKFGSLMIIIVGTLVWLAVGGVNETKTYYKTVSELEQMKDTAKAQRLRVAGDVEPGSIFRRGKEVEFVMTQDAKKLKVVYNGTEPLPDTFRDRAQAVADGRLGDDGIFRASRIQAKCASKYEAKPGQPKESPVYQDKRTS